MSKMTGHRYFAEAMNGYGVSHLFYVNTIIPPAMVEIGKLGATKLVIAHGEKAAAYMADGYARASNRPGVCLCQDIGSTNLAAGVRDAYMAGSPVIAISGGENRLTAQPPSARTSGRRETPVRSTRTTRRTRNSPTSFTIHTSAIGLD